MNDYILVALILVGVGLILVGWIWSMMVARKVSVGWLAGMAFVFIVTLPVFAIKHWDKAKKPFIVSVIGFVLTFGSILFVAEK